MKNYIILLVIVAVSVVNGHAQTLEDYFEIAAENNPGLQAKYKVFEASVQRIAQVSSLPDPNLSFGYFISPVETRVGPQRARFSLTQMFPWMGTLKVQEDAATLLAEVQYQKFLDERNKLYYQVAAAYYPLYELNKLMEIEKENIDILSSYKGVALVNFQNGKGTMVDVLRVDIMLKDAETNLSILEQQKKPLYARFNLLLNRNEEEAIEIQDTLVATLVPVVYDRDSLWTSNPLIEELDLKIKASEAQEKVAVKQGMPMIGVGLDYAIVGQRTDMAIPDNGKDIFMPMATMSLPIFRGKYKGAQREAQILQESYVLEKEEVANRLTGAYDKVHFEIQKQLDHIELYENQILISQQSLNLLFTAYSNSGKDFVEVLRMQQEILKYQKMKATALSAYNIAVAELDYITAKTKEL